MEKISERIDGYVEKKRADWGGALGNFLMEAAAKGLYKGLADMEPGVIEATREGLTKLKDMPDMPPEMRKMIDRSLETGNPLTTLWGWLMMLLGTIPALLGQGAPLGRHWGYFQELILATARLDPASVITAWRRDPAKYAGLFDDLSEQGFSSERIEVLKFISEVIPGIQDLIRMSVREAFSPEIAEKFGQYQDPPVAVYPWAEKLGLSKEWVDRYWAAHWELPSPLQGFEMLRRGLIDEATLNLLLRALDVMPFWRDKLIGISWEVPTRVDVRRFWEMQTIDEARMREIYTAQGYHGKDLDDYILWTKIYTAFPDLLARYKNGWITLEDVKREVVAMGMSPARADTMIEEKVKKAAPERTVAEKNLTKADIIAGVKKNIITRAEGAELLMDIGYSSTEAEYILAVHIPLDEEAKAVKERELTKSEILDGLKAGVITEAEAREKLLGLRYTAADAEFQLNIYRAAAKPPEEAKLKEASKADIVTGVKKGIISNTQGYMMLQDIGFSPEASEFILLVQATESPFSPMSYNEFKDITHKYRLATGREAQPLPDELKAAADELVKAQKDADSLKVAVTAEQRKLIPGEILPEEATKKLKQLQVSLRRAEATLAAAKTNYDSLVAQWRQRAA